MKTHLASKSAMTVHRRILTKDRIVYLLVGKKPFKYKRGRSRIAYIGTSRQGAQRIANSAGYRADEVFSKRGSKQMEVFIASCAGIPGLKSWGYLERAFLALFYARYKSLPLCNKRGRYTFDEKLSGMFSYNALFGMLSRFDGSK